jgi:DNA-binding HxlR family transcriptional regulator
MATQRTIHTAPDVKMKLLRAGRILRDTQYAIIISVVSGRITMMYGQFCPVAKATEVLGGTWTLLILRELVRGTCRFGDFQRALARISPTVLTARLKHLEEKGIIERKQISGQRGYEYRLTPAGKELRPVIIDIADWGMRWARGQMTDDELDVELLMFSFQRDIKTRHLPDGETVICFIFNELDKFKTWWLIINGDDVDLCTVDQGKDVDVYFTSDVRTMVEIWSGDTSLDAAMRDERIYLTGAASLIRGVKDWFGISPHARIRPAEPTGSI